MKYKNWVKVTFSMLAGAILLTIAPGMPHVRAQTGGPYELTWRTIAGGGDNADAGGSYAMAGTIGQPGAGTISGGNYTLAGGFWVVTGVGGYVYLPMIMR